jgi:penicillin-binding protein 1C
VYIPVDLDGKRSRVILKAIHRDANAKLYWHLDEQYLGETKVFHDQAVSLEPGRHKLMLLDQDGHQLVRWFKVLGEQSSQ